MKVVFDRQIDTFSYYAEPLLLRNEAENNLILGICSHLKAGFSASSTAPVLIRVNGSEACAVQTPPNAPVLSRSGREALVAIASALKARGASLPGVIAPAETAMLFAEVWCGLTGARVQQVIRQGIYQLDQVILPPEVPGTLRPALAKDHSLLVRWMQEFSGEESPLDRPSPADTERKVAGMIARKALFVWERPVQGAPAPVAMAGTWGATLNGIRVNAVFTPPAFRGQGIASQLVAQLSQRLLNSGRKFCFLYTDLADPASNALYPKIGYRFISESRHVSFINTPDPLRPGPASSVRPAPSESA